MKIIPILSHKPSNEQNIKLNFGASYFEDFNNKYSSIKSILRRETDEFIQSGGNATKLGEGIGGETYRFDHPHLNNIVIKKNKTGYSEDYSKEYNNLTQIPTNIVGGQEAVARVSDSGEHYLISTLVPGKCVSKTNRYNDEHLRTLFNKMFELDKLGIYHGDLNGKNILIGPNGAVNFIDYQWTEKIDKINFFDSAKSEKILMPISEFPENAQMFEMASMPWYMESFETTSEKEQFLKKYIQAKSKYHEDRYEYIQKITQNWPYSSEHESIKQSLASEKAKADIYKNPDKDVLRIEMKKIQFLSDYRDAYSHVDPNLPNRNILASPSSYLCSISSVQDYRKEVIKQLGLSTNRLRTDYLKSMLGYGDYWYGNLVSYTDDTYEYILRMASKKNNSGEEVHKFYINERNPRVFTPNLDLLEGFDRSYRPLYESGFDAPYRMNHKISSMYEEPIRVLSNNLSDSKSIHKIEKLKGLLSRTRNSAFDEKLLDTLNASEVAVLKIREFYGYVKHNCSSYTATRTLSKLLEDSVNFSQELFKSMFYGLQSTDIKNIVVKGYEGMRKFIRKI